MDNDTQCNYGKLTFELIYDKATLKTSEVDVFLSKKFEVGKTEEKDLTVLFAMWRTDANLS